MIDSEAINGIIMGVAAILGSGGIVAIIHEMSIRRKVKGEVDNSQNEIQYEHMKYFTEEIKRVNEQTKAQFNELQAENKELKREISTLNSRLTDLVKWIMVDNATYRTWLENTLRSLDPTIDIPKCADPPISWNHENEAASEEQS